MQKPRRWNPICPAPLGLTRPVPIDPTGRAGPTPGQARGSGWRQTSHGLYVPADVDSTVPEQRILERSMLLPPHGAVTGWASLRLHAAGFFDGRDRDGVTELPVPLTVGPRQSRRPRDGVAWLQDRLEPAEVELRLGMRCTTVERALFDEMRRSRDVRPAAVALDLTAAAELTSIARMARYAETHGDWLGIPLVRAALGLASEDSWSPTESELRLVWLLDAKFPRPLVNQEIFDLDGRLLGIADLLHEEAGLVAEFDGGEHSGARQRSRDADRDSDFRDHDLEVSRFTGFDLPRRRTVVDRLQADLRRAKWLPPGRRTWTTVPPPGWPVRYSLDEILDQRDLVRAEHERWLREGDPDIRTIRGF